GTQQQVLELWLAAKLSARQAQGSGSESLQDQPQGAHTLKRVADGAQLARRRPPQGGAVDEPLQVADSGQRSLQRLSHLPGAIELSNGVKALRRVVELGQRRQQPPSQRARTHRRAGAVEQSQEPAARRAARRRHAFHPPETAL